MEKKKKKKTVPFIFPCIYLPLEENKEKNTEYIYIYISEPFKTKEKDKKRRRRRKDRGKKEARRLTDQTGPTRRDLSTRQFSNWCVCVCVCSVSPHLRDDVCRSPFFSHSAFSSSP